LQNFIQYERVISYSQLQLLIRGSK